MATQVYSVEEVQLDDGSTVTLKPANIKVMRKGQEMINGLADVEDDDEGLRRLLDIVCLCLKRERPEFEAEVTVEEEGDEGKTTVKKKATNYELMEELFNMPLIFQVIHSYLGINLADPKLAEAALKMMEEQAKAGTS
jgi:hypothetical protein